jgi:adhesin transport system outer membrane protein
MLDVKRSWVGIAAVSIIGLAGVPQLAAQDPGNEGNSVADASVNAQEDAIETVSTATVRDRQGAEVFGPPDDRPVVVAPAGVPRALADGVYAAVDSFPRVRAALLNIKSRQADIKAAKRRRLPSASVQALSFAGGNPIAGTDPFALNFVVDQPIWSGGRIDAQIDRANVAMTVSEARAVEVAESVSLQAVNSFFEAVLAKRRLAKLREGRQTLKELVETVQRRVQQQVSPLSDLTLAESRLAEVEQQITFAEAGFFSSREAYRQVTGLYDYDFDELPTYDRLIMHPPSIGLVEEASACNPTTRVAKAERELAGADTDLAKSQLFPQLSAQYSLNEITGSRFGLVVTAQLQNGFSQFSVIDASRTRELELEAETDAASLDGRLRITRDLILNASSRDQVPIAMRSAAAAEEVTASYRRQFIAGRRSWLDVVNAVREQIAADLFLVDSETSAMASNARIQIYSCRWVPVIEGP